MTVIAPLQTRLAADASTETKAWWERYLKGAIEFGGVPMAGIRAAVRKLPGPAATELLEIHAG